MVNKTRLVIGIIIWIGLTIFVTNRFATRGGNSTDHVSADLVKFSFLPRRDYQLDCDSFQVIRIGDPIYRRDERGRLVQIGEIAQVDSPDSKIYAPVFTDWARATFYASAPKLKQGDYLAYHETPASMDWVIRFMLPPEKQKEIAGMIAEVYAEHSSEILEGFLPVVQRAISEASVVVREDLVAAINKRHQQWSEVGDRFRIEVVEQEIIPLVNNEIWPIVQKHSRPLLEKSW